MLKGRLGSGFCPPALTCADAPLAAMDKKSPAIAKLFTTFSLLCFSDRTAKFFFRQRLSPQYFGLLQSIVPGRSRVSRPYLERGDAWFGAFATPPLGRGVAGEASFKPIWPTDCEGRSRTSLPPPCQSPCS